MQNFKTSNDPLGQTNSHASSEHCFLLFCFARFEKWGDGRTTCAKTMIPTGRDFGLAEWININIYKAIILAWKFVCFLEKAMSFPSFHWPIIKYCFSCLKNWMVSFWSRSMLCRDWFSFFNFWISDSSFSVFSLKSSSVCRILFFSSSITLT